MRTTFPLLLVVYLPRFLLILRQQLLEDRIVHFSRSILILAEHLLEPVLKRRQEAVLEPRSPRSLAETEQKVTLLVQRQKGRGEGVEGGVQQEVWEERLEEAVHQNVSSQVEDAEVEGRQPVQVVVEHVCVGHERGERQGSEEGEVSDQKAVFRVDLLQNVQQAEQEAQSLPHGVGNIHVNRGR